MVNSKLGVQQHYHDSGEMKEVGGGAPCEKYMRDKQR